MPQSQQNRRPAAQAVPLHRKVTVLGSTGSVGTNTLDLLASDTQKFRISALTGGRNALLLAEQARKFRPGFVALADESEYRTLKDSLAGTGIACGAGDQAVLEAAAMEADVTVAAISGFAGLKPALTAIEQGNILALANKESLVCAGAYMTVAAQKSGCDILPVDSEHNAIFQVLDNRSPESVKRLILTASGGPFLRKSRAEIADVTPAEAVAHPNWSMGAKISVDSATMMNKALEVIEAHYLFGLQQERIDVLMHPQSIVHSMVEYIDGSILAQLGASDMRTPIAYALAWPERMPTTGDFLDLTKPQNLEFLPPDELRFPALALVREVLKAGGAMPTVFNSANEVAVAAFLDGAIGFTAIESLVAAAVEDAATRLPAPENLEDIFAVDQEIRALTSERIARMPKTRL
ncbi:MAG: 1-deoxy-D-xylulose-5-phosphate reductoisomerase [Alphaproteobacteria bacterium]|nr:MAG: 1-deoxy-D-xylulose-5-phosphate reductoisomerase [Alphaproteobacteria bacterium]